MSGEPSCTGVSPTYNLVINCQTITVTNPGANVGTVNQAFSQQFTQSGAHGTATFTTMSADGMTWELMVWQMFTTAAIDNPSVWFHDTGTTKIVYLVGDDTSTNDQFRLGLLDTGVVYFVMTDRSSSGHGLAGTGGGPALQVG